MPKSSSLTSADEDTRLDQDERRPGNLHGRRCGRPLRRQQQQLFDAVLPSLEIDLATWNGLGELFATPRYRLRLEIGFGAGEHLAAEADRNPDIGYIGCEPFRNGIAKMVDLVVTRGLDNVRLFIDDAAILLDALPDASLEQVDLLYPDPWPKRRQRKRRFVSADTLRAMARVLVPGGTFHFATDIDDYAGWTLARIAEEPLFEWNADQADDWRIAWPDWSSTRYEAKALREGRKPVYLTFRRL